MDPFAAVSFAATILAFVDFSWGLAKGTYEVYQSATGQTIENVHINDVISDLRSVSEDLDGTPSGDSKHEKALRRLAAECSELSAELMALLKKLKRSEKKNSVWGSLRVKWASIRKAADVESILDRLREYRSEIMLRLGLMLNDQQSSIKVQLDQIRKEASDLNTVTGSQLDALRSDILEAVASIQKKEDDYDSDSETLYSAEEPPKIPEPPKVQETTKIQQNPADPGKDTLRGVHRLIVELISLTKGINIQHEILKQLDFKSRYSREDTIHDAHSGTFEWMLEESVEGDDGCCPDDGGSYTPEEPPTILPGSNFGLEAITVEYGHGMLHSSFESAGYVSSDDDGSQGDASEKSEAKAPSESAVASTPISGIVEEDPQQREGPKSVEPEDWKPAEAEHVEALDMTKTERAPAPSLESEHDSDLDGSPMHPRRPLRKESVFMSWLHYGSHIFHISGKAGSGKSTLMKFLYNDARTKLALMEWAGRKKLVTAHFYFWRSAQDELQMSLDGLYRSILFEVLCQCPDLIVQVFPQQWDAMAHQGTTQPSNHMAASAVKRAFELLAAKASNPTHRFCLFIDGLDEYHGDSAAHWELARHLQAWTRQADIKMAISARPHTEFLVTFAGPPNTVIHLHTLTRDDIYRFSLEMFAKDANTATISADSCEDLARRIVDKAEGVFLWAWLTVRLLLDSLGRRDKLDVLMRRLDGVPEGLDDLYQRLLATVLGSDRRRSDLMLLLAVTNPFPSPLNAVVYSWLDDLDADPGFPMCTALPPLSTAALTDALDYVRRQLHSLTKGLLEVCPVQSSDGPAADAFFAHGIQFFHRTAMDYLAAPAQLATLRIRHYAHLDVDDAFARLRLAEYTSGFRPRPRPHFMLPSDLPHQFLVETLHCLAHDLAVPVAEGFRAVVMHDDVYVDLDAPVPPSRAHLGYSVPPLCATHGNTDGASVHDSLARASWPHFAAAYAQTRYVLHLVARQPRLLLTSSSGDGDGDGDGDGGVNGEGADLSLLLSAMTGGDAQLVRELLGRGASAAYACVSMRDRTHRRGRLPVWVLAVANCVWQLIEVFAAEQKEAYRYSQAKADAPPGPAGSKAVRALGDWLAIGDGNGLVLGVYEASPRAAEAGGRDTEHKRKLQHGVIDGQLQLRAGSAGGRIDNWGATSDGDEAAVWRYTNQTEGDEESGDDDDDSEIWQSESGSERSFFAIDGLVFRRYSCTASRFLSLCEQRDWNLDGERHNTQPPPEPDPPEDGQSDDITHSWLFSPRENRHRPPVQLDERLHVSLSWEGSELGLPFTYRVY